MKHILILLIVAICVSCSSETSPPPPQPFVLSPNYGTQYNTAFWYPTKIDTVRMEKRCYLDCYGPSIPCDPKNPQSNYYVPSHCECVCKWFPVTDTTWAAKVPVWLTPDELRRLMEMLRHTQDTYYDERGILQNRKSGIVND